MIRDMISEYFLPVYGLAFNFLNATFEAQKFLNFDEVRYISCFFYEFSFWCHIKLNGTRLKAFPLRWETKKEFCCLLLFNIILEGSPKLGSTPEGEP